MNNDSRPRKYRQTARARAAEETGSRILDAFMARLESGWFDEIRLDDVAADAEVATQTVIRRFGGKEGLLTAATDRMHDQIIGERKVPAGDVGTAIDAVIGEYERRGDVIMRLLAQEDRCPPIRQMADRGRATHRAWVGEVFAPWLDELAADARRDAHDRLVIALDIYVWKLVRLDMKRPTANLRRIMLELCASTLELGPDALERGRLAVKETHVG